MKRFTDKMRLIFVPFLLIAAAIILGYTLLNWLLFIKTTSIELDEDVRDFFIPFALPGIPVLIWLRPRIKLLNLHTTSTRGDPLTGYIFVAWAAIAVPTLIAQQYLVTETGKLTSLENIGQINGLPATKYYTAQEYYVSKQLAHVKTVFTVSGKSNTDFNMAIYAPVPVFSKLYPDTTRITAMREHASEKTLVVINGKISTMQELKKLPADSIRMMKYINPTLIMPKYSKAGQYGALAVATMGYKISWKMPLLK